MKMPGRYFATGLLLVAAAAVLVAVAVLTNRGDITSAAVVIAGMVCAVAGIFILTFAGGEPIDPRLVSSLFVQDQITVCRIAADLGINGNACFLPKRLTGEPRVMLFNPVSEYTGGNVRPEDSFPMSGPAGLVTVPPGDALSSYLFRSAGIPWTDGEDDVTRLLKETICASFEFATDLSAHWEGDTVTVTFHEYRFTEGCRASMKESPRCCSMRPCAACSLCGALIAESMDVAACLDRCTPGAAAQEIVAVFTLLPDAQSSPVEPAGVPAAEERSEQPEPVPSPDEPVLM